VVIHRVALVFDDTSRPETTGVYCRRALAELAEVEYFRPDDAGRIPPNQFDLYLNVDDGLEYRLPERLRPCAWWAIDTHLNFPWCLEKARGFDLVFAAQRNGAERLEAEGVRTARWLPLACDPGVHGKVDAEKAHDVAFVGNVFPGPRADLLKEIRRRFARAFVGNAYFEEMARVYSASRVVFNRSIRDDVNMRVFEALASGSLLVTNDLAANGQAELFRDGVHLATYSDAEELFDKLAYYLRHEPLRERVAAAGRVEVLAKHTYRHRMETVLELAGRLPAKTTVRPSNGSAVENVAAPAPAPMPGTDGAALDDGYYEFDRPELLELIPRSARRVLDVGCGAGRLGEALKARQSAEVVGVELSAVAARKAGPRLDRVLVGDAERMEPGFEPEGFDCVVCGDVLEHLREPGRFLGRVRGWLRPGGVVVASLPNARHHSVVTALLGGNWTYESAGLLDATHLSFFTRRDMLALFEGAGFRVTQVAFLPTPEYEQWKAQGAPGEVRVGALHVGGMPPEEAEEFFVYQYLLVAEPDGRAEPPEGREGRQAAGSPATQRPALALVGARGDDTARPARDMRASHPRGAVADAGGAGLGDERPAPSGGVDARTRRGGMKARRMRFTQDFLSDFDQFDFRGRPFAFVRFGDGERSICRGVPLVNCDGWRYDGAASRFAADLNASLTHADPDYYVGISDGCCDREARDWFLARVRVPLEQLTFANVFVNGNYRRFRALDLSGTVLVSSAGGDFTVPEHLINSDFDLDALVDELVDVDRPILVAAGPASCVLIHKYWLQPGPKQVIVDVGSALDEVTKGRKTRGYHHPGSPTSGRICVW
jgi:2-polyprenyl-3-methyl-5-hydroxy-6-metoxy-1,4-benzoquinol methylase